jgi:hypothetical protein
MDKDDSMPDFGLPTDFQMPDFHAIGSGMKMLSWLPAILSGVIMFILIFLAQVIYNGVTRYDYNMTYGTFMMMTLISLVAALVTAALVKTAASRRARAPFGP